LGFNPEKVEDSGEERAKTCGTEAHPRINSKEDL
jgi:hypothetical protein